MAPKAADKKVVQSAAPSAATKIDEKAASVVDNVLKKMKANASQVKEVKNFKLEEKPAKVETKPVEKPS